MESSEVAKTHDMESKSIADGEAHSELLKWLGMASDDAIGFLKWLIRVKRIVTLDDVEKYREEYMDW